MISQQKVLVDRLAALADAKSLQVTQHKRAIRRWRRQTLGRKETLIWLFAAGAWMGASRTSVGNDKPRLNKSKSASVKKALGIVNASLLTWRYLNKPLSPDSER